MAGSCTQTSDLFLACLIRPGDREATQLLRLPLLLALLRLESLGLYPLEEIGLFVIEWPRRCLRVGGGGQADGAGTGERRWDVGEKVGRVSRSGWCLMSQSLEAQAQ